MKTEYHFYTDPGHGWLRVPLAELIELGIADSISGYSYVRHAFAYLEEDCDMTRFIDARNRVPDTFEVKEHYSPADSIIRNFTRYQDAHRHLKNARQNAARKARDDAARSVGMVKVRGNLGGTYWE